MECFDKVVGVGAGVHIGEEGAHVAGEHGKVAFVHVIMVQQSVLGMQ